MMVEEGMEDGGGGVGWWRRRKVGVEIITSSEVEQLAQTGLFPFYFNHITNFPPRRGATSRYPHLISKYIWIEQKQKGHYASFFKMVRNIIIFRNVVFNMIFLIHLLLNKNR